MKSYESSTATLRGILAHPSLARDNIDRTLEALAEANADAREMDDAVRMGGDLSTGVADAVGVDEDDLEAELRAMVKETEDEAEQARELVRRVMEDALALDVPLVADARLGATWAEVH